MLRCSSDNCVALSCTLQGVLWRSGPLVLNIFQTVGWWPVAKSPRA